MDDNIEVVDLKLWSAPGYDKMRSDHFTESMELLKSGHIPSAQKIYTIGHSAIGGPQNILEGQIIIEEKIDGSSLLFGVIDGQLGIRSKGQQINIDVPEKMFAEGVNQIKALANELHPNWIYRGEYLKSKHHNALSYDRVPNKNIIIYDILTGLEQYLSYPEKANEATRLGFEVVPLLFSGIGENINMDQIKDLLNNTSVLGGVKIEGVVIKNYQKYSRAGEVLMAKFVSEDFKEVQHKEWKKSNPTNKDVLLSLMAEYTTKPRWDKAIIHSKENGKLLNELKDIPILIKEVQRDIEEECKDEIKEKLWNWAKSHILRASIHGLPEFYKEKLLKNNE